jgi:hypothetical protein
LLPASVLGEWEYAGVDELVLLSELQYQLQELQFRRQLFAVAKELCEILAAVPSETPALLVGAAGENLYNVY